MAPGSTDSGGVTDTPEAIRSRMTETRETLSRELGALRGRLFGTRNPARNERGTTVAKSSKKSGAAGKAKAAKGGAAKKKAGGAKKSAAKGAARKGGAKKTGAKKARTAKSSASRTTSELPTISSSGVCPRISTIEANDMRGSPAWMNSAWVRGIPSSRATSAAISSARSSSPMAMASNRRARSSAEVWLQVSNASRAAATARSTSPPVPSGIDPITSSVVELRTSIVPGPEGFTQSPPM